MPIPILRTPALRRLILMWALLGALAAGAPPAAAWRAEMRCFPETGQCIAGPIAAFWEASGGLPVFGFPLTPLVETRNWSWRRASRA